MIFQTEGAIDKILRGEKTETRRLWKPEWVENIWGFGGVNENAVSEILSTKRQYPKRDVYQVGKTYAVQPGRGKPAVWWRKTMGVNGTIETHTGKPREFAGSDWKPLRIRILELRREDVRQISNVGLKAEGEYDYKGFMLTWCKMHDKPAYDYLCKNELWHGIRYFDNRPPKRYDAVAIRFEVVK